MIKFRKIIHSLIREIYLWFLGIINCGKNAKQACYYPELKRKYYIRRFIDGFLWSFSRRTHNKFYSAYGFDIKNFRNTKDYVDENKFWSDVKFDNYNCKFSQSFILRDKLCFYSYLKFHNINTPEVFAFSINGKIQDPINFNYLDLSFFKKKTDYFVKDFYGECASYVKHVSDFNEFKSIFYEATTKKINCIYQNRVLQNKKLDQLNPKSINTLRIVTLNDSKSIRCMSAIIRIGTKNTDFVDNWAKGGYAVGINEDGTLKKFGFKKPTFGTKYTYHEDTLTKFEGFKIPFFQEAIELAISAHSLFYTLGSIGWDIAITKNGPIIIEGNDNFEISLLQACNGGLKKIWDDHIKLRKSSY